MTAYSYQLYSSRNFPPLEATLQMVAQHGYAQVEGYGALFADDDAVAMLARELVANNLAMPTAHFDLGMLADAPDRVIEIARAVGIDVVIAPYLAAENRPSDVAGWAAFGRKLAKWGGPLWEAGLRFGWHNHDFEFVELDNGAYPMDLILAADERLLVEFDVAWVVKGGQDPLAWILQYSGRVVAAHIKDIAPAGDALDEDGWADVGHGTMDWAAIVPALSRAGVGYLIMEHDNPSDDERFAGRSIATASSF